MYKKKKANLSCTHLHRNHLFHNTFHEGGGNMGNSKYARWHWKNGDKMRISGIFSCTLTA